MFQWYQPGIPKGPSTSVFYFYLVLGLFAMKKFVHASTNNDVPLDFAHNDMSILEVSYLGNLSHLGVWSNSFC